MVHGGSQRSNENFIPIFQCQYLKHHHERVSKRIEILADGIVVLELVCIELLPEKSIDVVEQNKKQKYVHKGLNRLRYHEHYYTHVLEGTNKPRYP